MHFRFTVVIFLVSCRALAVDGMVRVGDVWIDQTEVSVAAFTRFAKDTDFMSQAEQDGGGQVYALGWQQKPGWVWSHPFGSVADPREPVVHITFDEATQYCQWRGARLPTDAEWMEAAYTEHRDNPPAPFETGKQYPYPTGDTPDGANCLADCGASGHLGYVDRLMRGFGPVPVGTSKAGVNGLYDMGGNAWEWVDGGTVTQRITRGGSWWYGAQRMHREDRATKPPGTAVVYLGFRCAKDT